MPASDAAPLPRDGEVFFDVRGESRTMRVSWYTGTGVAVFSIWHEGTCTGTFRLPIPELPRLVGALTHGPSGGVGPLPQPGHGDGLHGYEDAEPGYGDAPHDYEDAEPGYGDAPHDYEDAEPGYGDGPPGYEDAPPVYGDGPHDYEDAEPGYGDGPPGYEDAPRAYYDVPHGYEDVPPAGYRDIAPEPAYALPGHGYEDPRSRAPGPAAGYGGEAGFADSGPPTPSGPLPVGRWHEDGDSEDYAGADPLGGGYRGRAEQDYPPGPAADALGDDPLGGDYGGEAELGYLPGPPTETFSPVAAGGSHSRRVGPDARYEPGPAGAYEAGHREREYRPRRGRS